MVERLHRNHSVVVLAFAHGDEDHQGADVLRQMGMEVVTVPYRASRGALNSVAALLQDDPLTTAFFGSRQVRQEVETRAGECDVMVAFSSSMGAYLLPYEGVNRILHFCELDSDKWRQYANRSSGWRRWVYGREARVLLQLERQLARSMNTSIVCSPVEKELFDRYIPDVPCSVLQNGVDLQYFAPVGLAPEPGHLVFTGVMDYFPNVDACEFFAREVLPRIRERHADARFTIVGSNPSPEVLKLAELPGVAVTGRVADTRAYLRRASVCVAPLRIARGIQNKVLEGLAMGLPVVGTTAATQGVGGVPGQDYLIADGADAQVAAVTSLLGDSTKRGRLAAAGRRFVAAHYDWGARMASLDDILARLPDKTRHGGSIAPFSPASAGLSNASG
jgi:sugar transferase (PEP-CTERM/EpsH1 system associated)